MPIVFLIPFCNSVSHLHTYFLTRTNFGIISGTNNDISDLALRTKIRKSAGTLIRKSAGTLIRKSAGTLIRKSAGTLIREW